MTDRDDPKETQLDDLQRVLDDADPAEAPAIAEDLAGELGAILDAEAGDADSETETSP